MKTADPAPGAAAPRTERVLVVGTGLIGGSLGMALRRTRGYHVVGLDVSLERAERARALGACDDVASDIGAAADATLVVLATPVGQILPTIEKMASILPTGTVVTDTGSAKQQIVRHAEEILGPTRPFVGGHPMAGTEGEGVEAARADLFDGALWTLTPTDATDADAYRRVNALVAAAGARTLAVSPVEHDSLVALVSHLPYTLATVLMDLAAGARDERVFRVAAGSFRDLTRTAGSNPGIWRDILAANRDAVLATLDAFVRQLDVMRMALEHEDWTRVEAAIAAAGDARQRLPWKGERAPADPVTIEVPVADRSGVLAELTTALGEADVNIEDLWMDHTSAGGVVYLVVDGRDTADRALSRLGTHGFRGAMLEGR